MNSVIYCSSMSVMLFGLVLSASAASPAASSIPSAFGTWSETAHVSLADGVTYTCYELSDFDSHVHLLSIDLTNPNIVLETVLADELCPNPNRNANSNNGRNLRETLSETCLRRRDEGREVVAGVNTGFFNSDDGFPRGFHIEYDEPVFINNPYVREHLKNHRHGFAFFSDRSVSFAERSFEGHIQWNGIEIDYHSINDTVVMQRGPVPDGYAYVREANLYTWRMRAVPHPERPDIRNEVGTDALFITGRSEGPLRVNCGYLDGRIVGVADGRGKHDALAPYVTRPDEWVLQLTGETARRMAAAKIGDPIRISADVWIGNERKSIVMYNASMSHYLRNGVQVSHSAERKPATTLGIDTDGTLLKIVCVDGSSSSGSGMTYDQLGLVMRHLGMTEAIRFDGGGSTCMWIHDSHSDKLVCRSCDSNGPERSCINYLHVRILK